MISQNKFLKKIEPVEIGLTKEAMNIFHRHTSEKLLKLDDFLKKSRETVLVVGNTQFGDFYE